MIPVESYELLYEHFPQIYNSINVFIRVLISIECRKRLKAHIPSLVEVGNTWKHLLNTCVIEYQGDSNYLTLIELIFNNYKTTYFTTGVLENAIEFMRDLSEVYIPEIEDVFAITLHNIYIKFCERLTPMTDELQGEIARSKDFLAREARA